MVLMKKLFTRIIYHCPYCNLCRLGKGLGIDYFHCMTCNACMSRSLLKHTCREKCFMDNCPICNEDIFTSNSPVKALPCGHLMHSTCFEVFPLYNFLLFSIDISKYSESFTHTSDAASRPTPVLIIPVQSVASHLGTCRSVTKTCEVYRLKIQFIHFLHMLNCVQLRCVKSLELYVCLAGVF